MLITPMKPLMHAHPILIPGWEDHFVPKVVATSVDGVFLLDVLLNFFVAIEIFDDNVDGHIKIVKDLPSIGKKYLSFWFWVDLISSFPFDVLLSTRVAEDSDSKALFVGLQGLKILKFGRSTRMINRLKLNGHLVMDFAKLAQIMKMMAVFLAFAHLNACLFWVCTKEAFSLNSGPFLHSLFIVPPVSFLRGAPFSLIETVVSYLAYFRFHFLFTTVCWRIGN